MLKMLEGHTHTVSAVAISTGGGTIVSGSHDMTVRVWSADTWQVVYRTLDCWCFTNKFMF